MDERRYGTRVKTSSIALYGILCALTVIATMMITIPMVATQGYINLGDSMVLLSGLILGPIGGLVVGGVGSALADIFLGYAYYAPYTFVIKGIEGLLGITLYSKVFKGKYLIISMILSGLFMATGYLLVETFLYGFAAALASYPGNIIQGVVGGSLTVLLYKGIKNHIK